MLLSDTAVGQGEAMLRESLLRIIAEYKPASVEEFAKHPLAKFICSTAEDEVLAALGGAAVGLKIQGSAGAGNWATVPWISVFDLTATAKRPWWWPISKAPSQSEVRPRVDAAKEEPSATEKPTEEGEADAMSPRPKWLN